MERNLVHVSWFYEMAYYSLCIFTSITLVFEVNLPEILFKDALF